MISKKEKIDLVLSSNYDNLRCKRLYYQIRNRNT